MSNELYFDAAPVLAELDRQFTDARTAARVIGVHRETISRWRAGQRLQAARADEVATELGFNPSELWPDWHERHDLHEQQLAAARAAAKATKNNARTRRRAQARTTPCLTS